MKMLILLPVLLIALQSYALKRDLSYRDARRNGAMAKIGLMLVNDDGVPVSHADIDVFMGMNFRSKGYTITGRTDTNGVLSSVEKPAAMKSWSMSPRPVSTVRQGLFALQRWDTNMR